MNPDEIAFQRAMDESRFDRTTYLVFADWLEERGDPRAAGYRAMGTLGLVPYLPSEHHKELGNNFLPCWCSGDNSQYNRNPLYKHCCLPIRWYRKMTGFTKEPNGYGRWWIEFATQTECRDAAANAWLMLTDAERATILSPSLTVPA